ncbi:variant leucine-rich repeat-containing protein [Pseudoclavibacter sp. 13-3]|uniref:variant leucine-rich repeat-containing protein n=1 Tax=Pseudoclavibacter sp. 13-3 TaxID=2901228 RepID=UPI001E4A58D5|nr:hypothetical protein [Pseudoclavibacter sp. 13-3]MCD7101194.1 hypothetical protein [Pseudoclavibacter sp. 13-3]
MHSQTDDAFFRALMAGAHDPRTTPAQLQAIAQYATHMPQLIPALLVHPHLYPALDQWLRNVAADHAPDNRQRRPALLIPAAGSAASAATATATGLAMTEGATGVGAASSTATAGTTTAASTVTPVVVPTATSASAAAPATTAATTVKAGSIGIIGKIGIGAAAVALAAGGGTTTYVAAQHSDAAPVETTEAAPAHASLSDDALRKLLKTAPLTDADRRQLTDGTNRDVPSSVQNFTNSVATGENWTAPTPDASGWTPYYLDEPPKVQVGLASNRDQPDSSYNEAPKEYPIEENTAISDVNGDGSNDILAFVTDDSPHGGTDTAGEWYLGLTAYTPNQDGTALDVLDQIVLVKDLAATPTLNEKNTGGFRSSPPGDDPSYWFERFGPSSQVKVGADGVEASVYRYTYSGGSDLSAGTLHFPVIWKDDHLELGDLRDDRQVALDTP